MVEAFIEEGFLSYDDLTFLEPAQLGELAGLTEEQAEDIIAFAEEAAEQVEEEAKAADGRGRRRRPQEGRSAPPTPAEGARQAFESLFAAAGRRGSDEPTADGESRRPRPTEPAPTPAEEPSLSAEVVGRSPPDVQATADAGGRSRSRPAAAANPPMPERVRQSGGEDRTGRRLSCPREPTSWVARTIRSSAAKDSLFKEQRSVRMERRR